MRNWFGTTREIANSFVTAGRSAEDEVTDGYVALSGWDSGPALRDRSIRWDDQVAAAAGARGGLRNNFLGLHDQLAQQVGNPMAANWEGAAATQAQARVAEAALEAVVPPAGDEKVPGLERPLANVLADYVDDTHAAFGVDGSQPYGSENKPVRTDLDGSAHIEVNRGTLIRVMRGASEDPEAFAVLKVAENRKYDEVMRDIPPGASEEQQLRLVNGGAAALDRWNTSLEATKSQLNGEPS
ncbi:hypothetical protein [Kitasatospora sp. NPDC057198]|uniref:hypothetical protein n=1 Tax=Kitasatospora sp. NPDC057198 TaxID=3346046 RepID=UPI00363E4E66